MSESPSTKAQRLYQEVKRKKTVNEEIILSEKNDDTERIKLYMKKMLMIQMMPEIQKEFGEEIRLCFIQFFNFINVARSVAEYRTFLPIHKTFQLRCKLQDTNLGKKYIPLDVYLQTQTELDIPVTHSEATYLSFALGWSSSKSMIYELLNTIHNTQHPLRQLLLPQNIYVCETFDAIEITYVL